MSETAGKPTARSWIDQSLSKLQSDHALFALAEMSMQDWCRQLGGVPTDAGELLALRCSLEPAATKLLDQLMAMPDDHKRTLAHRLWPASRAAIAKAEGGRTP